MIVLNIGPKLDTPFLSILFEICHESVSTNILLLICGSLVGLWIGFEHYKYLIRKRDHKCGLFYYLAKYCIMDIIIIILLAICRSFVGLWSI